MSRLPRPRRLRLAGATAACMLALAACGTLTTDRADTQDDKRLPTQPPLTTTAEDWQDVAAVLGRTGTLSDHSVYRIPLPRTDLTVTSHHVVVSPGLALTGSASFARYHDGTMLMGDLVITERELPEVTDALQKAGIAQTALHKHLLTQHPAVWWTHIHAMGNPVTLAKGVKAALDTTGIPPASPPPASQQPLALDTADIDAALGTKGTADGGIYRFIFARTQPVTDGRHILPHTLGIATAIGFQPLGDNRAAINGDFVLTADETQNVIRALRSGGIDLVELHNHGQDEQPRLFYLHFWATGDGVTLASALRPALDRTAVAPAS
ncbi:DUF1259 domain-containing protein [Streptomyces barringtoniae]|uniref:DUF1259 domain-containing protein n=1 Tax=Streptomyces barringtoniae TaxID=2892029 RepID=UPI001E5DC34F|nr:DUF1259 domain-containing protein [Streptomyces barringtoniae]MCC5480976.1 DUF1259 domain-containing protein [Streptomyces barringtoniae]